MVASYSSSLVGLSMLIAILASYTALDLASRIAQSEGRATYYWLIGGAFSMGIGIWSMHFIGMLAFSLPIPIAYDVPITLASVLPAIAASGLALFIFRRKQLDIKVLLASAVLMGLGISAMHYTGMAAMRMQPPIDYDPILFLLSLLIAIGASGAALWIARWFTTAGLKAREILGKLGSAVVMGFAIVGMHYTGMAAAHFVPGSVCLATPYGVPQGSLGILVGAGTLVLLVGTLMLSIFDARLAEQARGMLARLTESNEGLRRAQAFLNSVVDNIPNMLFVKDAQELKFVRLNRAGEQMIGFSERELLGKSDFDFFPKVQADFFVSKDRETLAKKTDVVIEEETITTRDGTKRTLYTKKLPILASDGTPQYLLGIAEDITERRAQEEQLRIIANALENTAEGVVIYDREKRVISVNKGFTNITGYTVDEAIGKHAEDFRSDEHDPAFYDQLWHTVMTTSRWQGEIWRRRKSGEAYPALTSVTAVKDRTGEITHYVTVATDISQFKKYEANLRYLAHHDVLTGLPNRSLFRDRVHEATLRARRHERGIALLFIDLDRFKMVNDSLGHAAGDKFLQTVALRLQGCVRDSDTVARLAGDEFTVLIDEVADPNDIIAVAEKLLANLVEPIEINGHRLAVSASIGISCFPQDGADADTLLKNADVAMYQAKMRGRNSYQFFSEEMNKRAMDVLVTTNELRGALDRQEFVLYFQPRVESRSGALVGVEALIRWQHPVRGLVSPAEFIPVLEDTGLIIPVGEWVIRTACRQALAWATFGAEPLRVAVNLSPRQFHQRGLAASIRSILDELGVDGSLLELEITEGTVMQDPLAANQMLVELKALGVKVAVDDFGTGYSSLSYLRRFPVDYLKIDQSFVRDIPDSADGMAIVQAIIALASSLRLKVIAEGVESEEQRHILKLFRCDEIQGYVLSRPLPARDFEEWWTRHASPEVMQQRQSVVAADGSPGSIASLVVGAAGP